MTLKVKVNDPLFSVSAEGIQRCMFGANLTIPVQIGGELSCGQSQVYEWTYRKTDGQMDRHRQQQYPFGLKGQKLCSNFAVGTACGSIMTNFGFPFCVRRGPVLEELKGEISNTCRDDFDRKPTWLKNSWLT